MQGDGEEKKQLPADIRKDALDAEAKALINEIIAETDVGKAKDLTYLFNANQNKKTLIRMDTLSELQDKLVGQFSKRVESRPDEITTQELMVGMKTVQDLLEKSQKQVSGAQDTPLIQINQQTNSVTVGQDDVEGLSRASREKVKNAVLSLLSDITAQRAGEPIDADVIEKGEEGE